MPEKPEKIAEIEEHIKDIQEISIAIDSWDDVFSDFDPSPIDRRILSEDFLSELKKRYRETQRGDFVITIYAPASLKDETTEKLVNKRLKQYFKFRHLSLQKEIATAVRRGTLFVLGGVASLSSLTMLTYFHMLDKLTLELIAIIFMPLGWFGIWEGFSRIIEPAPFAKLDEELFSKLSKASFKFKYAVSPEDASFAASARQESKQETKQESKREAKEDREAP
ncbi:MAG: hypothetical protein PHH75_02290 [Candidatus Omnitrophica bacterium]|nr:hypothetical protein [Candidatus Omnitrophota bacterium]MDD5573989.1 hypothetical protein [Candidatus Omnitrophota bacterium]